MNKHSILAFIGLVAILTGGNACKTAHMGKSNQLSYGGSFPDKTALSVEKQSVESQTAITEAETRPISSAAVEMKPIKTRFSAVKSARTIVLLHQLRNHPLVDSTEAPKPAEKPMEPTARVGFWLVIGGLIGSFIPYLGILALPALLAGFILGIIALSKINKSNGELRGRGKAIASIVIPVVLTLLFILLVAVFFAAILAL